MANGEIDTSHRGFKLGSTAFDTNIVFNLTTEQFVQSVSQPSALAKPRWFYGDTKHLLVQFVRNSASGLGTVEVVPATGITLQLGVASSPGGTVLTSATAGPADSDHIFTLDLPLNVVAINTALGTNAQLDFTLEFRTTESGVSQRYQGIFTIRQQVLSDTVVDPPGSDPGISAAQALNQFWPRMSAAGDFQIQTSPNGSQWRVWIDDDGVQRTSLLI